MSLLDKVKKWWNETDKSQNVVTNINKGNVIIDGYKLFISSGHRAFLGAKKENKTVALLDCDAPDTPSELLECIRNNLDTKGGKRKTRSNRRRKSKKSRKNRRKSNRRRK
jgi:hypothetical protein